MMMSVSNNDDPSFRSDVVTHSEYDVFTKARIMPLTLVADIHCLFGFRGSKNDKYSIEVAFGDLVQSLGRPVVYLNVESTE